MTWSRRSLCLLAILLTGCLHIIGPANIGVEYYPPDTYKGYWAEMVHCSGVTPPVSMEQVQFREVPGAAWHEDSHLFIGLSGKSMGQRYIILASDYMFDEQTVKHEMLHTILNNRPGHPFFPGTWPCGVWSPEGYVLRGNE